MESQKKIEKNEKIRVLNKGQKMVNPIIMIPLCCSVAFLPIRPY